MASVDNAPKRLNINLSPSAFEELQQLSEKSGTTMTEIVKTALGLAKVAYEERKKDNVLAVVTEDGKILKQIVIPK
jgi:hypothetical protein